MLDSVQVWDQHLITFLYGDGLTNEQRRTMLKY
jgi:hypothetical protein